MRKPAISLRNALDREVYQVVRKLQDDAENEEQRLSSYAIYTAIKKSNSSLKRKPKILLEDSIERILAVLQEENNSDSDEKAMDDVEQEDALQEDSNAMNQRIVRAWTPKKHHQNHAESNGPPVKKQKTKTSRDAEQYAAPTHVSLSDLGGMDAVIEQFEEYLMLPLKRPERYIRRGLKIPRGILLHGPPGCGKTMLAEAVAAELGLPFMHISAPSVVSGMSGESEKQIRDRFDIAKSLAPCLMFIDEIDAITPKRESAQREMERRIVGQLLTCMDDLALEKTNGKPVIVLAATNRPDSLDPALRRAGRFDAEINIGVPNAEVREQILRAQTRQTDIASDVDFKILADRTPGWVGADLESLVYRAGSNGNGRYLEALKALSPQEALGNSEQRSHAAISAALMSFRQLNRVLDEHKEPESFQNDSINMQDFLDAIGQIQPSAKREGFATIPDTNWTNIGALVEVRKQLQSAIVEPIRKPERYARFGIAVPAGVLLWGPPGCGKTLLAKAVANESRANFISVKGPELLNKYVGESERAVRQVFLRARSSVPCVIFFDELDALVPRRDDTLSEASARVVNTLLTELDGLSDRRGIYVIAATNRPDMIDPAMLRPGRLGKHLFVDLPGPDERIEILMTLMKKMPVIDRNLAEFAKRCDGFSGADLGSLAYEAAQHAVERNADLLDLVDLEAAMKGMKPSVGDMSRYYRLKESLTSRI